MNSVSERLADSLVGLRMPHTPEAQPTITRSLEHEVINGLENKMTSSRIKDENKLADDYACKVSGQIVFNFVDLCYG